ncbi:DUF7146 domain-containing protein [Chitinimonas sp. JJ19]|uniref:DUF7146 domain-containing protein n=1 Tax=Chitinimonas sp. JJ19 TaxID=3109352 RepID=UPI0030017407
MNLYCSNPQNGLAAPGLPAVMPTPPAKRLNQPRLRPLDADTVRQAASGRWPAILTALGLPAPVFGHRRNQPCPCCGGTDRFQWIDKDAGRFVCRALDKQGGDGFALVMHWQGSDFKTALAAVAGVLGLADTPPMPSRQPAAPSVAVTTNRTNPRRQAAKLARLWAEAAPIQQGDPVARYLAQRGLQLTTFPDSLRLHPALPYWCELDGQPHELGRYPAMLAQVIDSSGKLAGLHRTYLNEEGGKLALRHPGTGEPLPVKKLMVRSEKATEGAAIPLQVPHGGRLALAEGVETALAVHLGSGLPVWACVSAGGLQRVALPEGVQDVFIFADHDASQAGQQAAERLRCRLQREGLRVRSRKPAQPGTDWLDVYAQSQAMQQPGHADSATLEHAL